MGWTWAAVAAALVIAFLWFGQGGGKDAMDPAQANAWIASQKNLQLVDVRTPQEYAEGHLPGAKNIPLDEVGARMGEVAKDKPLLLYCHSGRRSGMALKAFREKGYDQAQHMRGGIAAWGAAGFPVVR